MIHLYGPHDIYKAIYRGNQVPTKWISPHPTAGPQALSIKSKRSSAASGGGGGGAGTSTDEVKATKKSQKTSRNLLKYYLIFKNWDPDFMVYEKL